MYCFLLKHSFVIIRSWLGDVPVLYSYVLQIDLDWFSFIAADLDITAVVTRQL